MTPEGRVLGGSKFKMPHGYSLALPIGAYQTTTGNSLEGEPILPAREGNDTHWKA